MTKTAAATAALDALELLDGARLDPPRSRYAKYVLARLTAKPPGQVVNRSELLVDVNGIEYVAPDRFRLEPEWLVVVLAALVQAGEIVLAIAGKKFDATAVDAMASTPIADLVNFKHLELPKDWNVPALKELFELLGLAPGLAISVTTGSDEAVQQLQSAIGDRLQQTVETREGLNDGIPFWGQPTLTEPEQAEARAALDALKTFLESLQPYTTPGKLKNLAHTGDQIAAQRTNRTKLAEMVSLRALVADLAPTGSYLQQAQLTLSLSHPWGARAQGERAELLADLTIPAKRATAPFRQAALQKLAALKKDYVIAYVTLHARARLGLADDNRKKKLLGDDRLTWLKRLSTIAVLSSDQLSDLQSRLAGLRSCFTLTESGLKDAVRCPHCSYNPMLESTDASASARLTAIDAEIDTLLGTWMATLLQELDDPTVAESLELLSTNARKLVDDFVKKRALPAPVTNEFVTAVQEVLAGLIKIVLKLEDVRTALTGGSGPATPSAVAKRFQSYLDELAKGKELAKVRVVVE